VSRSSAALRGASGEARRLAPVLLVALACAPPSGRASGNLTRSFDQTATGRATADAGSGSAPGAPGAAPTWAPAQKSFLGTSRSAESRVYFTGHRGALTEIFYPTLDAVQSVGLQFFIADAARGLVDEEAAASPVARRLDPLSLRWQVVTENPDHGWRLTKDIFTDPERSTLIVRARLEALGGRAASAFQLYVYHDPALENSGGEDASHTRAAGGRTLLVAAQDGRASALAASAPWATLADGTPWVSNGFVGVSDGRADLFAPAADARMSWAYDAAEGGNVAQLGWLDTGQAEGTRFDVDVVLGFGTTENDAIDSALQTLGTDRTELARRYDAEWRAYASALDDQGGSADDEYRLAALTLIASQDKSNGAMIAAVSTPWGETRGDEETGGYHLVWSRDLFKFANALLTAGDLATGRRVVHYLFESLVQTSDCGSNESDYAGCVAGYSRVGRFPQNTRIAGQPYWTSTQLDEQAMPLLLARRLYEKADPKLRAELDALWPKMQPTAEFILGLGPWTLQERWEENSGYSPSSIAAGIAGLVAASDFARTAADTQSAARYLAAADDWQQNVERWTFTHTGPQGNGRYYLRLNPSGRAPSGAGLRRFEPVAGPDSPLPLTLGNGGGVHDQREIVDAGFLELVRFGAKSPNDPYILESLPETDALLKQTIPGKGDAWWRYNLDGYGERNDGGPWDGTAGRGRLWPIFTAERGMYEIARSGNGQAGTPYLAALRAFATPEGFIPEQVWNLDTTISGSEYLTPAPHLPGTATGSVCPLNWAMGEYMSLLASIRANAVVDIPANVCRRYNTCSVQPAAGEVLAVFQVTAAAAPGQHLYVTGDGPALGDGNPDLGLPMNVTPAGSFRVSVALPSGAILEYAYYRKNADGTLDRESGPGKRSRRLSTRASGTLTRNDRATF
jgi:glucoamylase